MPLSRTWMGRSVARATLPLTLLTLVALAGCGGSGSSKKHSGGGGGPPQDDPAASGPANQHNDPLYGTQWYLVNSGQTAYASFGGTAGEDIGYAIVTEDGTGVVVAVVDTGIEIAHEDLAANINTATGAISHNFANGSTDPTNTSGTTGDHGTSVSGIIAARSDNGIGITGIAGRAGLVGYNLLGPQTPGTLAQEADSLGQASFSSGVDAFNQSWGFDIVDPTNPSNLNIDAEANYSAGVTTLRGGLGAVYVKSAGNGFDGSYNTECYDATVACQNANMDPYNTIPYQIVVGAVNAHGLRSSYSTPGSALWVSAPGGEFGYNYVQEGYAAPPTNPHEAFEPAIVTTDQSGCAKGYSVTGAGTNYFDDGVFVKNAPCNYTSTFNGTSSAAPVTSGVVALLLGANPNLTWRDVKHILASTAVKIDAGFAPVTVPLSNGSYLAEPGWTTNGAGYHFHNYYGFGRINAAAAATMAAGYNANSWPAQTETAPYSHAVTSGAIPDDSITGVTDTIAVSLAPAFTEAVIITVNITHTYAGDVGIELRSPASTRSVVLNTRNGFGASTANFVAWQALSNAFYGENPNGTWTLKVVDGDAPDTGTLNSWSITILGH